MSNILEQVKEKPWTGWALAGVILIGAVVMYIRLTGGGGGDFDGNSMGQMITIKYTDTDEEEQMTRGELLKRMLTDSGGAAIDPNKGIVNPKTGKPTGFLHDKGKWNTLVKDVNEQRAAVNQTAPGAPKPPTAPQAPSAPKAQ